MTTVKISTLKKLNDSIKHKRLIDLTLLSDNDLVAELKKRGWDCAKPKQEFDFSELWSIDYQGEPMQCDFDLP